MIESGKERPEKNWVTLVPSHSFRRIRPGIPIVNGCGAAGGSCMLRVTGLCVSAQLIECFHTTQMPVWPPGFAMTGSHAKKN